MASPISPPPPTLSDLEIQALLKTPIQLPLHPSQVQQVLSTLPFIPLPGALNLRTVTSSKLLPNKLFRSGVLTAWPASSLKELRTQHNIRTVFDLRSASERVKAPSPEIEGIETLWVPHEDPPVGGNEDDEEIGRNPVKVKVELVPLEAFAVNDGLDASIQRYYNVVKLYGGVYKSFFELIRDGGLREGGLLFHCTGSSNSVLPPFSTPHSLPSVPLSLPYSQSMTLSIPKTNVPQAGKDRTGILSALLLALLNTPPEEIAHDYALSRIGTEPGREMLLKNLLLYMGLNSETDLNKPGVKEMCGVSGEVITAFLRSMNARFGADMDEIKEVGSEGKEGRRDLYPGVVGYMKSLGFREEDLEKIRIELRGKLVVRH